MRTIKIYGASDDLVELEGTEGGEPDEFSPNRDQRAVLALKHATVDGVGMRVVVQYSGPGVFGCWEVGVAPLDEDIPFPDWPMRLGAAGYTATLEIDVPDNIVVERLYPPEED